MSLFLVSKRFGHEARQAMCENCMFTEVGLPWPLAFCPLGFDVIGGIRFVRKMTDSWTPSYCTLTIRLASSFNTKSFLMLVNVSQLEMFVRWCAIALALHPGGLRDFEHIIRYHQPQLTIVKKAGWEMRISRLLQSRWFGFRRVSLNGFGDDAISALEAIRGYPWTSYDHFLHHILSLHNQSSRSRIHASNKALNKSTQALFYVLALETATRSEYAHETWLHDWRPWQWRELVARALANNISALWHVLVRDVKILCFSRRDERLYEKTLRRARHTLDYATSLFYYSVYNEGPDTIDARRDFCMIAVLACLILDQPALREAPYQKGKDLNLPMTEYNTSPRFTIVSPVQDPYTSIRSMMHHIFNRYRPRGFEQPMCETLIWGPKAVRPRAVAGMVEFGDSFEPDGTDTLDTTNYIDKEDDGDHADDADDADDTDDADEASGVGEAEQAEDSE